MVISTVFKVAGTAPEATEPPKKYLKKRVPDGKELLEYVSLVKAFDPVKIPVPIVVTVFGISISINEDVFWKAFAPIVTRFCGNSISLTEELFVNEFARMVTMDEGKLINSKRLVLTAA